MISKKENSYNYSDKEISEEDESKLDLSKDGVRLVNIGNSFDAGIQMQNLQSAISNYASELNNSAIAKSTGQPVKTPIKQYKGFAFEEYSKQTLKINALAEGIHDYQIGVYTKGELPDGSTLSGIDMHSDVVVYGRKWPWQKPVKVADAQLKMHGGKGAYKAYAKDMANSQYSKQEFVGGSNQGVNDRIHVNIGGKNITSDSQSVESAIDLASEMKNQNVEPYAFSESKIKQLNRVNMKNAVGMGAISGGFLTAIEEICKVIKNRNSIDEKEFKDSIIRVLGGTIDGGVRGGAITGAVQTISKIVGKEITTNSAEAVPIMAIVNASVDLAKDLYDCFVKHSIDQDDLLCNTVNNSFSSFASFGGSWIGAQLAGHAMVSWGSIEIATATGASIGAVLGPMGTIVGSVIGAFVIGNGAKAIIGTATKDAIRAYEKSIREIEKKVELEGFERLYYFADTMDNISEFRLSFKNLLPCYNLISDLKEYNLHKKAIKNVNSQIENMKQNIDNDLAKKKIESLTKLLIRHGARSIVLEMKIDGQKKALFSDFKNTVESDIQNSYLQYIISTDIMFSTVDELESDLIDAKKNHDSILEKIKNRKRVNEDLNRVISDLIESDNSEMIRPYLNHVLNIMNKDELLIDKQHISYGEALNLVSGERHV